MSGNLAVLRLPDDHRLHVQLSTYFYASTLAKLRSDIAANRHGIAVFEVAAPINAPLVHVAMDRRTGYVLGFRGAGSRHWWAFSARGHAPAALPGAPVRAMGLTGSYTELALPPAINMRPEEVLNQLASYGGAPDPRFCQAILLLLFLVAEAMRFDSVLMGCVRYFSTGTGTAYTIHPAEFTDVIRNWRAAMPADRNVLLHHLP